jgi:hypothetical protein
LLQLQVDIQKSCFASVSLPMVWQRALAFQ